MPNIESFLPFFIAAIYGIFMWRNHTSRRRRKRRLHSAMLPGTSVLLSYYTENTDLLPISTGEVAGLPYSAITTYDLSILLIQVELDFTSQLHLLGIPKDKHVVQLDPTQADSLMERVNLEGDYDTYFSLYCEKGEQVQARYILDPKAMIFTVDFCRSHNWEIIDNALYFVQASHDNPADSTSMFEDIPGFIATIQPALATAPTSQEAKNAAPYGIELRHSLDCPLCHAAMPNTHGFFICPNGDGMLCSAAMLFQLRSGQQKVPTISNAKTPQERGELVCPSCQSRMVKIPYNGHLFVMDTCTHCNYRWLDAPEVPRLVAAS
jgi:hypothetical protein